MRVSPIHVIALTAASFFCTSALAHPGHGNGAVAGILHPLLGLDHILAMLAVGIWAARLGGRARWLVPASFLIFMVAAAAMAMAGVVMPLAESGIAASVLLAGLLIAFSIRMQALAGSLVVAMFAVVHGYAHGLEMPAQASPWLYGAGFVLSTALLHGIGLVIGAALRRQAWALPAAGSAIAACGGWLMLATS